MRTPFTQSFELLPETLPIFPLQGAVLLPGGNLPLNIFEPRYLNMVQDAMQTHRLIGMIQPRDQAKVPALYDVGCAGRVTRFLETQDGRLEIVLTGVCRFRVQQELDSVRGYRIIIPTWSGYESDYSEEDASETAMAMLHASLRTFFEKNDIDADWNLLDQLNPALQVSTLLGALPLKDEDKQLLLETSSLEQRLRAFALLLMGDEDIPAQQH